MDLICIRVFAVQFTHHEFVHLLRYGRFLFKRYFFNFIRETCRFVERSSEIYINSAFEQKADCKNIINAPYLLRVPAGFNRTLCFEYAPSTIK